MVYYAPVGYTARKPFTAKGVSYTKGALIPAAELRGMKLGPMISRGYITPHPDPHARNKAVRVRPQVTYVPPAAYPVASANKVAGAVTVTIDGSNPLRVICDADFRGPTVWDMGDGNVKGQQDNHTTHYYAAPGSYTVRVESATHAASKVQTITGVERESETADPPSSPRRGGSAQVDTSQGEGHG